ncbi:MAG: hypothetical protein DHS20C12_27140 [Pseudohongiella sp.]|nr:MAG: hypothetical protein DHS20C12_27140 [Pseudohongiella sp.]
MLVLNRRVGEVLTIGEEVSIVIVAKSKNSIRFGIDAPRDVQIHRAEVQLTKGLKNEKKAAPAASAAKPSIRLRRNRAAKVPDS